MTTADDNEMGRFPGAQPRGPRAGFAAEGPVTATSSSRANERVNAASRSQHCDRSERETLISASGSAGSADSAQNVPGAESANGERKPNVAILLGAVYPASPVRAGDPVLEIAGNLQHSQPGAENVDGESDLDAPARRQR